MSDIRIGDQANTMVTQLEYDFTIPKYVTRSNDDVFVNLNLETGFAESQIEDDREVPVELSFFTKVISVVNLEIPESYRLEFIPENSTEKGEDYGYQIEYGEKNNVISYSLETYSKSLIMETSSFEPWNKLSKNFRKAVRNNIVLRKSTNQE